MFKRGAMLTLITVLLGFSGAHIQFFDKKSDVTVRHDDEKTYEIQIETHSETTIPAPLRWDTTLVFANGRLVKPFSTKEQNSAYVRQTLSFSEEESARYDIMTWHQAQMNDNDGTPIEQHAMSRDQVYILSSSLASDAVFRQPVTNTQTLWKNILDRDIERQWTALTDFFQLDEKKFEFIPLYDLPDYEEMPLPPFTEKEKKKVISLIWAQIYEKYILGKVDEREKPLDPHESLMPLIAVAQDGSHFRILFRTRGGKALQIIQPLLDE